MALAVFKTVRRQPSGWRGGFDSLSLPPNPQSAARAASLAGWSGARSPFQPNPAARAPRAQLCQKRLAERKRREILMQLGTAQQYLPPMERMRFIPAAQVKTFPDERPDARARRRRPIFAAHVNLSEKWRAPLCYRRRGDVPWTNGVTERATGGSKIRRKTVRGYKSEDRMPNGFGLRRWAWSGRDGLDPVLAGRGAAWAVP